MIPESHKVFGVNEKWFKFRIKLVIKTYGKKLATTNARYNTIIYVKIPLIILTKV